MPNKDGSPHGNKKVDEVPCAWCRYPLRSIRLYGYGARIYGYRGGRYSLTGSPFCSLRCGHDYAAALIKEMPGAQ